MIRWFRRLRKRRDCFHHIPAGGSSMTYIKVMLIDNGRAKMFVCTYCDKRWIV